MRVIMRAVFLIYLLLQTGFSRMFFVKKVNIEEQNPNMPIYMSRESTSFSCFVGQTAILNLVDFEFDEFTYLDTQVLYMENPDFNFKNSSVIKRHHYAERAHQKHNKSQFKAYITIEDVQEEDAGSYESMYQLNVYSPYNKTNLIQIIKNRRFLNLAVKPWEDSTKTLPYICSHNICT